MYNKPMFYFLQAILGTVISALTGSEDPKEVSKMAVQATEVFFFHMNFRKVLYINVHSYNL